MKFHIIYNPKYDNNSKNINYKQCNSKKQAEDELIKMLEYNSDANLTDYEIVFGDHCNTKISKIEIDYNE
jgi:hypothetical protein